ncbi:stage V sporulation protein AD [Desulfonispora thiosulfatigenes DSM 11270]|uniref:Stage V sporulation protein AD n=1 Tax=Desulfonispora thiosulfatigenes DSM 11270 TaxID=656914 RepID=A0A1W1VSM6_DESTI|nr:stage V sporulation protein AD [Desulfonispora thiosulfatigenes]SMB96230.1 stage V sporulation protein AD [Desulfonispora thiosulfatigenes DSM 11270]
MNLNRKIGNQTINFINPVSISSFGCVVGKKEKNGPLGKWFEHTLDNNYDHEKTWEKSEQKMLQSAMEIALEKKNYIPSDLEYFLAGDLLNQIICSNFTARSFGVPYIGLYGACSTLVEGLILGSMIIDGNYGQKVGVATSSHYETAERQLRFPTELGVQRAMTAQWTVTGSGSFVLENQIDQLMITQGIFGKVIDMGISNAMNMGAAMAPAAADTIVTYFKDTGKKPEDIDLIVTGDLGNIGRVLCKDLVQEEGFDISSNFTDCGVLVFDPSQDVHAGGSGAGCSSSVLAGYLLPQLLNNKWKSMLLVGTGALLSPTSSQQGESIPGIAHGVLIEKKVIGG